MRYIHIENAKEEIWRRWNDNALRQEVETFLGEVPSVFRKEPKAVLFRQLMTPNYECIHFFDLARDLKLHPLGWEYLEDIFLTINKDKAYLGKMGFMNQPINGNGVRYSRVIRLNEFDASQWYASKGGKAKEYYQYFIALFLCHGILFENFITDEREREFTRLVVKPSIEKIEKRFGVKPLIVQLTVKKGLNERYYPEDMASDVLRCLANGSKQ